MHFSCRWLLATCAVAGLFVGLSPAVRAQSEPPPVSSTLDPARAADLLARAKELRAAGKSAEALSELQRVWDEQRMANPTIAAQARFLRAEIYEAESRKAEAMGEYHVVAREYGGRIRELAAEALYRGGLYAFKRYGSPEEIQRQGLDAAWQFWNQLRNEYKDTEAYRKATAPTPTEPEGALAALMKAIDTRNSKDWKYQVIHAMVRITGSNPTYSYGLALILLAALVKLLLFPLSLKQYASMREMQRMQPLIKELQKKYKGQELQQQVMAAYKEHGVSPFAGCWPMLIQLPFLIMVFTAVREYEIAFSSGHFLWIGSSLAQNAPNFFGQSLIGANLAQPDIPLLVLYVISNYVTMRLTPTTDPQQQQQQNTMALFTSVFFFYMFVTQKWSSAFVLYWFAMNIFSIWQQYEYIYKPHKERMAAGIAAPAPSAAGGNGTPASAEVAKPIAAAPATRVKPRKKRK